MKKIKILSIFISVLCIISSCSKENLAEQWLIGKWEVTSLQTTYQKLVNGVWETLEDETRPLGFLVTLDFKINGSGDLWEHSEPNSPGYLPYTWVLSEQNLTIELGDPEDIDILSFEILASSKKAMTLYLEETYTEDGERYITILELKKK